MQVIIMGPTVKSGDAVGRDMIWQLECLKEEGMDAYMHAENYEPDTAGLISKDCLRLLDDKDTVLIYHHSSWTERGVETLKSARCTKVVKYHNITPEHYFLPYSSEYFNLCRLGRMQNREIMRSGIDMLLSDSSFNASEFLALGLPEQQSVVLAPFTTIHDLDSLQADPRTAERLSDGKANVFFIGRVAPNKGHKHILYTAYYYKLLYGENVRFVISGHISPHLTGYYKELLQMSKSMGISEMVEFTGRVSSEQLISYYRGSHAFLLLSEHEGFCVPILEAQHFRLPIIAHGSSAVAETMGPNQLVYDEIDYEVLASAVHALHADRSACDYLADEGARNFSQYEKPVLKEKFISFLEGLA